MVGGKRIRDHVIGRRYEGTWLEGKGTGAFDWREGKQGCLV